MIKIIKKIVMFVLPFLFLFINVSYIEVGESIPYIGSFSQTQGSPGGLNFVTIRNAFINYLNNPSDTTNQLNYEATLSNLSSVGYENVYICSNGGTNYSYMGCIIYPNEVEVLVREKSGTNYFYVNCPAGLKFYYKIPGGDILYEVTSTTSQAYSIFSSGYTNVAYTDYTSIKYVNVVTANQTLVFIGDYLYENSTGNVVNDLQIKKIIDELFSSTTYLTFPNNWRNNFFIVYNQNTNTYNIIAAPDYVYFRGYNYSDNGNEYYRILAGSSPTFDTYDFSNLVNNSYTEYTNPLGSFNFYRFTYECDSEGNVVNRYNRTFNNMLSDRTSYLSSNEKLVYTRRNIPFYTLNGDGSFDENVDSSLPSTELKDENGNIIPKVPPSQPQDTIVGNADFEALKNSFSENSGIFNFTENMQWLISSNNKLSNYFLGLIVMCVRG